MRAVLSAMMTTLIVLALLAGNCLSCPQMLLAMTTHQSSHGCCPHEKSSRTQPCASSSLRHFVKAEATAIAVPAAELPVAAEPQPAPALSFFLPAEPHSSSAAVPIRI